MHSHPSEEQVVTIDCHYVHPQRAAGYLVSGGGVCAFVDNNTRAAVPLLLTALHDAGLRPEQVQFLFVTHVHLDHCGGTAELLKHCPNAIVLAHPRAVRHLCDPARLVAGTKAVYGEETFTKLYGVIEPIPAERVRAMGDGEQIQLGNRVFTFLHTAGHANHHGCIHDSGSNGVFTGDTFGIAYPPLQYGALPMIMCSSTPTEFDGQEALLSVDKIMATNPDRVFLSHYGEFTNPSVCARRVRASIIGLDAILQEATGTDLEGPALQTWCEERVRAVVFESARECGLRLTPEEVRLLGYDSVMNASGLAYAAARRRRKANGVQAG